LFASIPDRNTERQKSFMSLQIGIVGLPNVGKSTLFNTLVKGAKAEAANYPFCTIEPNVGVVKVPDFRLAPLGAISKSAKIIPTVIKFIDIAGLVQGASKGEGLGNQFLAHIRECDAIAMVVRFFEDENVAHVKNKIDPIEDIETIETELQLADLSTIEKRLYSTEKEFRANTKESKTMHAALQKLKDVLNAGRNARLLLPEQSNGKQTQETQLNNQELDAIKGLSLLTMKPILYIANCSEEQLQNQNAKIKMQNDISKLKNEEPIIISAKIESDLNELSEEDKKEYLKSLGVQNSGLEILIRKAYEKLGLIAFFTSGEKETRAWTIHRGATAPEAAGVIHTDFAKGFIAAEIIPWQDFYAQNGWAGAKAHGLVRTEGKDYLMQDGDVALFRFNVKH
jgi:hypothetical protein